MHGDVGMGVLAEMRGRKLADGRKVTRGEEWRRRF